jgi:hypothetical protein
MTYYACISEFQQIIVYIIKNNDNNLSSVDTKKNAMKKFKEPFPLK